jgi:hypothetical protein
MSVKSFDLTAGKYVRWKDISRHANPKACKPWAMRVEDTDDDYGVDGEWLEKEWMDDEVHFDVSALDAGDIVKVSGASHSNRKHAYYLVRSVTSEEIKGERLDESVVIERLEGTNERNGSEHLREEIISEVAEISDYERLKEIYAVVQGDV